MSTLQQILLVSLVAAVAGFGWGARIIATSPEPTSAAGVIADSSLPPLAARGAATSTWTPPPIERAFWKPPGSTAERPRLVLRSRYWNPHSVVLAECEVTIAEGNTDSKGSEPVAC